MTTPIYLIDFESRSLADINLGGRVYWLDPTTEAVCMAWRVVGSDERGVWLPGDPQPFPDGATLAAHNMIGFDRFGLARQGWAHGHLIDTSELARRAGLPGALDALGTRLLGVPKDTAGNKVTMALSLSPVTGDTYDRKTGELIRRGVPDALKDSLRGYQRAVKAARAWVPVPADVLERVVEYCHADVEIMARAWPELEPWLDVDAEVSRVERVVNDRGVPFDVALAKRLIEEDARNSIDAIAEAAATLGESVEDVRAVAGSPAKFCAETGADNAQAKTVGEVARGRDPYAAAYAQARQALATIARGKLEAGLRREIDGRLYDVARYYGAHTGRWSGQGMQLQNMPRPAKEFEKITPEEIEALADRVLAGSRAAPAEIDVLLRATICAPEGWAFCVCDFTGVENRALAFYADDREALAGIGKVDPYITAAAQIFGVPYAEVTKTQRGVGKIAELALGYGGGVGALSNMAAGMGVDIDALGLDAAFVVSSWRRLHAPVVKFWYAVERAFAGAVKGQASRVSAFEFVPSDEGDAVAIFLPSGRPIVYNEPELQRDGRRTKITFLGAKSGREYTYGGKLVENLIQAACRDLMAEALVRVENDSRAPRPVMHVHDEIVCLAPAKKAREGLDVLERRMLQLPDWAKGFPIGADGYVSRRYKK